jgi:hypothetical protein
MGALTATLERESTVSFAVRIALQQIGLYLRRRRRQLKTLNQAPQRNWGDCLRKRKFMLNWVHHIELLQRKVLQRGAHGLCRSGLV